VSQARHDLGHDDPIEGGWELSGQDGDGRPLRLVIGESQLSRAYLGIAVGRHPLLCERVIGDKSVSRRHLRLGLGRGELTVEDLNSLNGTLLDDQPLAKFQPRPARAGQRLILGRVELVIARLGDG
jgi:hypothetical protein